MKINELERAEKCRQTMIKNFSKVICDKYKEIFDDVENSLKNKKVLNI